MFERVTSILAWICLHVASGYIVVQPSQLRAANRNDYELVVVPAALQPTNVYYPPPNVPLLGSGCRSTNQCGAVLNAVCEVNSNCKVGSGCARYVCQCPQGLEAITNNLRLPVAQPPAAASSPSPQTPASTSLLPLLSAPSKEYEPLIYSGPVQRGKRSLRYYQECVVPISSGGPTTPPEPEYPAAPAEPIQQQTEYKQQANYMLPDDI